MIWIFAPDTRFDHSAEAGSKVARCSSVMKLFVRPPNLAPTRYAAIVSKMKQTY